MDIISKGNLHVTLLDEVARAALGAATCGVSVGGGRSRIHLRSHNLPEQQRASDVLNHFGSLPLTVSASRLTTADADPVINCRADLISRDRALAWLRLQNGAVGARGQVDVVDDQINLTLSDLPAGIHDVFLYRLIGNYASGALRIKIDPA